MRLRSVTAALRGHQAGSRGRWGSWVGNARSRAQLEGPGNMQHPPLHNSRCFKRPPRRDAADVGLGVAPWVHWSREEQRKRPLTY
jgi:hypothetical protein